MDDDKQKEHEELTNKYVIDGVDVGRGIENVGGDPEVYFGILKCFVRETKEIVENLERYRTEDPNLFYMKIHGLKSSCAYIGANSVVEEAKGLERAVIEGNEVYISTNLFFFFRNIDKLLRSVGEFLIREGRYHGTVQDDDDRQICAIQGIPRSKAAVLREAILNMEPIQIRKRLSIIREQRYEQRVEIYLERLEEMLDNLDYDESIELLSRITEKI